VKLNYLGWSLTFVLISGCGWIQSRRHHDDDESNGTSLIDDDNPDLKDPALYRGYVEINQVFNERLFTEAESLSLAVYLDGESSGGSLMTGLENSLRRLLGTFDGNGLVANYSNAKPNSMNLLLWYMAMDGLGRDLEKQCDKDQKGKSHEGFAADKINPGLLKTIDAMCTSGQDKLKLTQNLIDFWNVVIRADSPSSERDEWLRFAAQEVLNEGYHPGDIQKLFLAMTVSPSFLLKK
jgi:hypothetical protein